MKNNKIIAIRTYQGVSFGGAVETSFLVHGNIRKKPVQVTINQEFNGVEVKSKEDHIFVPMTNVSCIYFESPKSIAQNKFIKSEEVKATIIDKNKTDQSKKPR